MEKIIRLTESELVNLIKKVLNEQDDNLVTDDVYGPLKKDNYTQKGAHFLIGKDGKGISLPVGTVWKHQCMNMEGADWLEIEKYNNRIMFHCGELSKESFGPDVAYITGDVKYLEHFKNSKPLIQELKKEYCLGNRWNGDEKTSKHLGCADRQFKDEHG